MITFESLLFLVFGLLAGRVFNGGFIGGYYQIIEHQFLKWTMTPVGFWIDIVTIFGFLWALWRARRPWSTRQQYRYYLILGCIIVASAMLFQIGGRAYFGRTFGTHDGAAQTEDAAAFLLQGKNPYVENYLHSAFAAFHQTGTNDYVPILHYYPYPPIIPLSAVPMVWLSHLTHTEPDARTITMSAFIMLCIILLWFFRDAKIRLWLVLGLFFNPMSYGYWILGMNDIIFVVFLVAAALCLQRRAWAMSGLFIALAIGSKQTAALALPLWGIILWMEYRRHAILRKQILNALLVTGGMLAAIFGPFLVWNAHALYVNLVQYVAGSIPGTYPIGGDSLWQFLVIFRVVRDSWVETHHQIYVTLAAILGLGVTGWWLMRRPTASQFLVSIAAIVLLMGIVNRFFFENYLAAVILLVIPAVALDYASAQEKKSVISTPAP